MPNINPDFNDSAWLARLASVGESWPGGAGGAAGGAPGGGGGVPPFSLNAPSRTGQGPFGNVPGAIGLPPVYNDVAGVFPNLSGNIGALSRNIGSQLAGELDPQTIAMLQNTAAQFGIGQGVPLSPFSGAQGLRHLGQTVEQQKALGAQNLLSALPTLAHTLTVSPETQLNVADRNATLNAAPDPAAAAREAQRLFDLYARRLGGGAGMSFGGGGGAPRNANAPGAFTPWAGFGGDVAATGSRASTPYYGGTGITWGNIGAASGTRAPQDLWSDFAGGFPGPEGSSVATPGGGGFNDWFNDPFIGGGGGMFGLGQTPPQYPDFPEWDT